MNYLEISKETKENLDNRINIITAHIIHVFQKQKRTLSFEEIYGDGSLFHPFNKNGAKMVYDSLCEAIERSKHEKK
ncbi:MAG: hypothetical protein WC677_08360 [Clostridia bacterium]|jgi:hypothetical protein